MKVQIYQAIAERDEAGWWVATVPEVPGVVTQAKRLEQLGSRVAEAIAVVTERSPKTIDVVVSPRLPGPLADLVERYKRLREEAKQVEADVRNTAQRAVEGLVREAGLTVRDAGHILDVSPQRVQQLTSKTRRAVTTRRRHARVAKRPTRAGATKTASRRSKAS